MGFPLPTEAHRARSHEPKPRPSPHTWQHVCKPGSQCESDLGARATLLAQTALSPEGWAAPAHGKDPQASANPGLPGSLEPRCRQLGSFRAPCPAQVPGPPGPAHFPPPPPPVRRPGLSEERGADVKWPSGCGECGRTLGLPEHLPSALLLSAPQVLGPHRRPSLDPAPGSLMLAAPGGRRLAVTQSIGHDCAGEGRWGAGSLPASSAFSFSRTPQCGRPLRGCPLGPLSPGFQESWLPGGR